MPRRQQLNLSNVISSMAQSVDEAVLQMKDEKISCSLEEFECSLELEAEADTQALLDGNKKIDGLKFSELKKMPHTDTNKSKIVVRAVFTPQQTE